MSKKHLSRKRLKKSIYFSLGIGISTIGIGLSVSIPVYFAIKNSLAKTKNDVVNLSRYILDLSKQLGVDPEDLVKDLEGGYKVVFSKGRVKIFQKKGTQKVLVMQTNGDGTSGYASEVSGGAGKVMLGILKKIATTLGKNSDGVKEVLEPFLKKSKEDSLATEAAVTGKSKEDIMLRNALGGGDDEYEKLKKDIAAGKTGVASVAKTGAAFMKAYKKNEKANKAALKTQAKTKAKNANALVTAMNAKNKSGLKKPLVIPAKLKSQQQQQIIAAQARLRKLYIDTIAAFFKFAKGKKINWGSTDLNALEIKRLETILKFSTEADLRTHLNSSSVLLTNLEKDYKLTRTAFILLVIAVKAEKKLAAAELKAAANNKNVLRNIANNPVSLATALARSFGYENPNRTKSQTDITPSKNIRNKLILEAKKGGMKAGDINHLIASIKNLINFGGPKNTGRREITFKVSSISITSGRHQFFLLKAISNDSNFINTFIMFDSRRHKKNDYKINAIDSTFNSEYEKINGDISILIKDFFSTQNVNEKKNILQMLFDLDKTHIPTLGPLYDMLWNNTATLHGTLQGVNPLKELRQIFLNNRSILKVEDKNKKYATLFTKIITNLNNINAVWTSKFSDFEDAFERFFNDFILDSNRDINDIMNVLNNMSYLLDADELKFWRIMQEGEFKALQLDISASQYYQAVFGARLKDPKYDFSRLAAVTDGASKYDYIDDIIENFKIRRRNPNKTPGTPPDRRYYMYARLLNGNTWAKFPKNWDTKSAFESRYDPNPKGFLEWYNNIVFLSNKIPRKKASSPSFGHIWAGGLIKPAAPKNPNDEVIFLMPLAKVDSIHKFYHFIFGIQENDKASTTSDAINDPITREWLQPIDIYQGKVPNINGDKIFSRSGTRDLTFDKHKYAGNLANKMHMTVNNQNKFFKKDIHGFSVSFVKGKPVIYKEDGTIMPSNYNITLNRSGAFITPVVIRKNSSYYVMLRIKWIYQGSSQRTMFIKNIWGAANNISGVQSELNRMKQKYGK